MTRRAVTAEAVGTALLLFVVVSSGVATERLAVDPATGLLAHAVAVGLGVAALIWMFGRISGAHLNPGVTLALWRSGAVTAAVAGRYVVAQIGGGIAGVLLAHLSLGEPLAMATQRRLSVATAVSELVASFALVALILLLVRTHQVAVVAPAVGAWVACAIFATSSTGFANPAVTIARALTDTYTGIAPASLAGFVLAQVAGAGLATVTVSYLTPTLDRRETA
jgi:glycerol uptake facilitator-like aquaporin